MFLIASALFVGMALMAAGIVRASVVVVASLKSNTAQVVLAINEMVGAVGGISEMANDVPTYIPLEDFMEARAMEAGPTDFDMTDLVFEREFEEVK
jgi:hypothetical protein